MKVDETRVARSGVNCATNGSDTPPPYFGCVGFFSLRSGDEVTPAITTLPFGSKAIAVALSESLPPKRVLPANVAPEFVMCATKASESPRRADCIPGVTGKFGDFVSPAIYTSSPIVAAASAVSSPEPPRYVVEYNVSDRYFIGTASMTNASIPPASCG